MDKAKSIAVKVAAIVGFVVMIASAVFGPAVKEQICGAPVAAESK